MANRSLVDALDLCTTVAAAPSDSSPGPTQGIGWLSPRISFSTGVVDKTTPIREVMVVESLGSSGREDHRSGTDDRALDFEFCMGPSSLDDVSGNCMLPADELFQKGRFLAPQNVPPSFQPRPDKVSVSFSGPLDTLKTPFVNVPHVSSGVSKSGPLAWEEVSFSGALPRPERTHPRFSGPLEMRPGSPSQFSGPLISVGGNATSSLGVACPSEGGGNGKAPKSQAWEKVIGLLRRARSDSHRDRLYPDNREQTAPARTKNSGSAASSLRLIFRRNSSIDKNAKAVPSSSSSSSSSTTQSSSSSHGKQSFVPFEALPARSSPPHPASFFSSAPLRVVNSKPAGLAALHVASPVYPTSSASELDQDNESDLWTSSATEVDLRPGILRESWRMHETESSLEISFDKFDKANAGDLPVKKKLVERSTGTTSAASNPSRIVLKNLERCSNPISKPGKGQEQLRALRTREIRRSPERLASYTSSVRVTPVLNVPVCIAPAMRSSKAAKGRLASLRSLLSFKKEQKEERQTFTDPAMAA